MAPFLLKVIQKACEIRVRDGEDLEDVLASYPKLSESEKEQIRKALAQ